MPKEKPQLSQPMPSGTAVKSHRGKISLLTRKNEPARLKILSGWKEIANYLGRGVRSVQRYEREMGLPIHRPAGKSLAAVIAIKTEIDEWITAPRRYVDSAPKRRSLDTRTNRLRADFLRIDSDIALTFATLALEARTQEKQRRTAEAARRAYDTILQLRKYTDLTDADSNSLDAKLRRLKDQLERLGQQF